MTLAAIGVALALVAGGASPSRRPTADARAIAAVTQRLLELHAEAGVDAAEALRARIARGVPPRSLVAWLDRFRESPRVELLDVVVELSQYRRADIRGRALAAWAACGDVHSDRAIAAAIHDLDITVRRLAIALARRYPSAAASVYLDELLGRDPVLAEEVVAEAEAAGSG